MRISSVVLAAAAVTALAACSQPEPAKEAPPAAPAAPAAPVVMSGQDTAVNLALGACLSEKTDLTRADAIDPTRVGVAHKEKVRGLDLTPAALRVPSTDGQVFYDHEYGMCIVSTTGVDAEALRDRLDRALANPAFKSKRNEAPPAVINGIQTQQVNYVLELEPGKLHAPFIMVRSPTKDPTGAVAIAVGFGERPQ